MERVKEYAEGLKIKFSSYTFIRPTNVSINSNAQWEFFLAYFKDVLYKYANIKKYSKSLIFTNVVII